MKIMFVGHEDFGNRGCEALVRSISSILSEKHADTEYLLPSRTPTSDSAHWPEAGAHNVQFIGETKFRRHLGWWGRILGYAPSLVKLGPPPFRLDPATREAMIKADAVIVTGGDILSLEYGLPSLYFWAGVAETARRMGKPVHLWAASIGPFAKNPVVEMHMVEHLKGYTSISVRESATRDYMERLGVPNVAFVADPAFVMKPEAHDEAKGFFDIAKDGVLGFNVSPLVRDFLPNEDAKARFDNQIIDFLRHVLNATDLSILLIPHVDPFSGAARNSDSIYMRKLLTTASLAPERLQMLSSTLNAAQLKYTLGRCRYFMGARTHATIGALSQGVPTISIAYSIKAIGINRDLFGNDDVVLPTPKVSKATLIEALSQLCTREAEFRALLTERIPLWRDRAREAAALVYGMHIK